MEWINADPISEEEIKLLQVELDIELPQDYCSLIQDINGAFLANAFIKDPLLGEIPYSRNTPLKRTSRISVFDIFDRLRSEQKELFPFGSVGNGDYFCFDLDAGGVVLWLHETDEIKYICDTYTELMNNLKE